MSDSLQHIVGWDDLCACLPPLHAAGLVGRKPPVALPGGRPKHAVHVCIVSKACTVALTHSHAPLLSVSTPRSYDHHRITGILGIRMQA